MKKEHLREDLFYRLNVITLTLPSLRERKKDIPLLASHFLKRYNEALHRERSGFSEEALQILSQYHWPGNVRELENEIERVIALGTDSGPIQRVEISERIRIGVGVEVGFKPAPTIHKGTLKDERVRVEKEKILSALEAERWKIERTAKRLNITRQWLRKRMNHFQIGKGK